MESNAKSQTPAVPTITLPKGGGALQGSGEKFTSNPVTGSGTVSIPIALSAGRDGFGPSLSLNYDSSNGNGPFGMGWQLSTSSITRKTSRGLPRYLDSQDLDIFLLSNEEDLVPLLNPDGSRYEDTTHLPGYVIHRYFPRTEGSFARIERCSNVSDLEDVHWRVISSDNVLSIYGSTPESRVFDPEDHSRIFSWLFAESRDCKGNAMQYHYRAEDGQGSDLTQVHQRNRGPLDDPRRSANRYLKSIKYGNRHSLLDQDGNRPHFLSREQQDSVRWLFEVVLDYGEQSITNPLPTDNGQWDYRTDCFSNYQAGFEVRTCRLCKRVLMYHHFDEVGENALISSMDLSYGKSSQGSTQSVYSFLSRVQHTGFMIRTDGSGSDGKKMPPVDFTYSEPIIQSDVYSMDDRATKSVSDRLLDPHARWIDLFGEGVQGMLTQDACWHYTRNLSPISQTVDVDTNAVKPFFGSVETVPFTPNTASFQNAHLLDIGADGRPSSLVSAEWTYGFQTVDEKDGWSSFTNFSTSVNRPLNDPTIHYLDMDGDGIADIVISEDSVWHLSLGMGGFGRSGGIPEYHNEEQGPQQVFSSVDESIYLADFTGDGLMDLVRLQNTEICYWPNLGYGKFGQKVAMDDYPVLDFDDFFDHKQVLLADIDGSGPTDMIYFHTNGVHLYINQCGNGWSPPIVLNIFPSPDPLTIFSAVDLFGRGTTVLVQANPLSGSSSAVQYIDLMGQTKPHLLTGLSNNMGLSTEISYSTSTKYYLLDVMDGSPWITKLPFPVQVVDSITTYDDISRNVFSTRFSYHHGFYDIVEREFRGFGMVEQWDYDDIATVTNAGKPQREHANTAPAYRLPPVHTKSWFHVGGFLDGGYISGHYYHEYYRDAGSSTGAYLTESTLPVGLTSDELFEALRCLRGRPLRKEIYCDDGTTPETVSRATIPYAISESRYAVSLVQAKGSNPFAVFSSILLESLSVASERDLKDPRISHTMTLEADELGNSKRQLTVDYGRLFRDPRLPTDWDRDLQTRAVLTYTVQKRTQKIDDVMKYPFGYRLPLPAEITTFSLTGFDYTTVNGLALMDYWTADNFRVLESAMVIGYEDVPDLSHPQAQLLGRGRTVYKADDLSGPLALKSSDTIGLVHESYTFALTNSMVQKYLESNGQPFLSNSPAVLSSISPDGGGYVSGQSMVTAAVFPASDAPGQYWVPSGQSFFAESTSTAQQELVTARTNFFIPRRYRNPFGAESIVIYDTYNVLAVEARDFIGNRVTAGERDSSRAVIPANDYLVLAPSIVTDANGNRTQVSFDALGLVTCLAVMGKKGADEGDSFRNVPLDLNETKVLAHLANPFANAQKYLGNATRRYFYDYFAYTRSRDTDAPQPCVSYSMSRVMHVSDLARGEQTEVIHHFSYSDGFGKAIQSKSLVRPGPVPQRDANGTIILGQDNKPVLTTQDVSPRWITSGWVISNNKGHPVRQFEPYFSDISGYEFDIKVGVSSVTFYDALGRSTAVLMPNGVYSKIVSNPWMTETSDCNDTVTDDPRTDADLGGIVAPFFESQPDMANFKTWYQSRIDGTLGPEEKTAAQRAAAQSGTPKTSHLDPRGRTFLTMETARIRCPGHPLDGTEQTLTARSETDALGRITVSYDGMISDTSPHGRTVMSTGYDLLGNALYKNCREKGESRASYNIGGKPIYTWDNLGVRTRFEYDVTGRPTRTLVLGDPLSVNDGVVETVLSRIVYGDNHWDADTRNLHGQVYATFDQSGIATTETINFEGFALEKTHRVCQEYKMSVDWSSIESIIPTDPQQRIDQAAYEAAIKPSLLPDVYTTQSSFDAIGRPIAIVTPHSSTMKSNTFRMKYKVTSLRDLSCNLQQSQHDTNPDWTPIIKETQEDAKGRRTRVKYGNDVVLSHSYNEVNQLTDSYTRRDQSILNADLQNLHYVYDAVGNIVRIRDDALQTHYFRGEVTTPTNDYIYDSTNRLVQAIGREHITQGSAPQPYKDSDSVRFGPQPGQADAMTAYTEQYLYNAASNMTSTIHIGSRDGWKRQFLYQEQSRIVGSSDMSNKLSQIVDGNGTPQTTHFLYDDRGNIARLPHLAGPEGFQNVTWDFQNRLRKLDLGGGGVAYYTYNISGQRVRKVIERSEAMTEDRLYLGEVEIYRKKLSGSIVLERETLHVHDIDGRVALIETRTQGDANVNGAPAQIVRFQISNHLQSSCIELDLDAQILSLEEYSPYGSTTYQATTANLETPKRYRFTGREREEESGLSYHGLRYLAPWLGRWISPDPAGMTDGANLYNYCGSNPISFTDTTGTNGDAPDPIKVEFWGPVDSDERTITIDEIDPIARQAKHPDGQGDPFGRARDSANKTFELEKFNNRLKGDLEFKSTIERDPTLRGYSKSNSLVEHPELLFSRPFNELKEMDTIVKDAVRQIKQGNLSAADYNDKINKKIWAIIKRAGFDKAPEEMNEVEKAASVVRKAFAYNKVELNSGAPTEAPGIGEEKPTAKGPTPPEGPPKSAVPEGPVEATPTTEARPSEPGAGGSAAGKALTIGGTVFFGAAAAGNAMQKYDQGKRAEAGLDVAKFGIVTAVVTKFPVVGQLLIPVQLYQTGQRPTTFSPEQESKWNEQKQRAYELDKLGLVVADPYTGMTPGTATEMSYLVARTFHDAWTDIKTGYAIGKKWWMSKGGMP